MASPRPVPPVDLDRAGSIRKNRSKTRSVYSGAMPTPRSVTAICTWPSRIGVRLTDTWVPAGE